MSKSFTNHQTINTLTSQAGRFVTIGHKLAQQSQGLQDQRAEARYAIDFTAGLLILIGLQLQLATRPLQFANSLFNTKSNNTLAPFSYKELMQMECLS